MLLGKGSDILISSRHVFNFSKKSKKFLFFYFICLALIPLFGRPKAQLPAGRTEPGTGKFRLYHLAITTAVRTGLYNSSCCLVLRAKRIIMVVTDVATTFIVELTATVVSGIAGATGRASVGLKSLVVVALTVVLVEPPRLAPLATEAATLR